MNTENQKEESWDGWKDCEKIFIQSFQINLKDERVRQLLLAYLKNGKQKTYVAKEYPSYLWMMNSIDLNIGRFLIASMLHDVDEGDRAAADILKTIYRYSYTKEYNSLKRIRILDNSAFYSLIGLDSLDEETKVLDRKHLPSITNEGTTVKCPLPDDFDNEQPPSDDIVNYIETTARVLTMLRVMGGNVEYTDPLNQITFDDMRDVMQRVAEAIAKHIAKIEQKQKFDPNKATEINEEFRRKYICYVQQKKVDTKTRNIIDVCMDTTGFNTNMLMHEDTDTIMNSDNYANLMFRIWQKNGENFSDTELSLIGIIVQLNAVCKKYQTQYAPKYLQMILDIGNQTGAKNKQKNLVKQEEKRKTENPSETDSNEIKFLRKQLDDLQKQYEADEQEIRHLNNILAEEKEKNRRANEQIRGMLDAEELATLQDAAIEEEINLDEIKNKKILIVGGHERWIKKMRNEYPFWDFALSNHENENNRFNVLGYDLVVFNCEHISHSDYYIIRNKIEGAEKNGRVVPTGYIRATNIRQAGEGIYRLLHQTKGGQDADRL